MANAKQIQEETKQQPRSAQATQQKGQATQGGGQSTQPMQSTGEQHAQQSSMLRRSSPELSPWSSTPFSFMRRFSEDMARLFEDFGFGSSLFGPTLSGYERGLLPSSEFGGAMWSPQIEMFQRGDQLVLRADLPGLTKDDVKVEVQNGQLIIQGERRQEHEEGRPGEAHYHSERRYGTFYRSIPLPEGVNAEKANATFRNGVLEVTLPAPREQAHGRRIEIRG